VKKLPKIISQFINEELPGLWMEGQAYKKENLYSISGANPPVNYDSHTINSHSLTHIETSKHTQENGESITDNFRDLNKFFGSCLVIKLIGNGYMKISEDVYHWCISLDELKNALGDKRPKKVLITTDNYPTNKHGFHDPNYVLTLSQEAAAYLVSIDGFNLYGTTWKSSDFNPGSLDRPIHNKLFEKAVILECLNLSEVDAGEYFLNAFPLPIEKASEAPVCAVLFEYSEI
jgi:kynurenine formamidase